ncbi:MAG: DUF4422 domain-containing protein [Bacteroidales bacterium]|jgi:hypothetical protein|nr:DUF4422 domain-containing protein [Bacteroidales bacterium]
MKNKINVKILVCCHKKDTWKSDDVYMPIHVGKALSNEELYIQGDDEGDNISIKNKSYCELSGLYWAWKNLKDVNYIGLCHYRRYFDFHNKINLFKNLEIVSPDHFDTLNLTVPDIDKLFGKSDIILAKPNVYPYSLRVDYCYSHLSKDISVIESIVGELYPDYLNSFKKIMYENNKLSHYNMFIMKWRDFENYCTWLFNILEKAEERIDITNYDPVQKRILGYIAERLLNVYVKERKMKIRYLPVFWVTDTRKDISAIRSFLARLKRQLSFLFQKRWLPCSSTIC